ncbi:hypothetical protein ACFYWS_20365 [Streptomyces sp. NPDC002795]|uniref:hypothetical protein n=1 Tax=Streptomyces sp. NPDC002795 TaxID=3364665 RepID=UPI0036BE7815
MNDRDERPDWGQMKPDEFGRPVAARQDALFLVDAADACGTEALDGLGFGAILWASPSTPTGAPPAQ